MSQPRPSRRGGKVSGSEGDSGAAAAPAAASSPELAPVAAPAATSSTGDSPALKSATPPEIDTGDSLLTFPTDVTTHIAVGTVRARGQAATINKRDPMADKTDVENRVREVIKSAAAVSLKTVTAWLDGKPPVKSIQQCDISIVSDAEVLRLPTKIVEESPAAKVLLVVPKHQLAKSLTVKFAARLGAASTGLWVGSNFHCAKEVKIVVTTQDTALTFLTTATSFGPFTHVVLAKTHSGTAIYQVLYAEVKRILMSLPEEGKRAKVILSGFPFDAPQLSKYFEPLAAWQLQGDRPAGNFTTITQDEAYALIGEQISSVPPARGGAGAEVRFATCHPKIVEANVAATVAIVGKAIEMAAGAPIAIVVYTGDVGDTIFRLRTAFAGKNVDIAPVLHPIGLEKPENKKAHVAVLNNSANEGDAHDANVAVVIDQGTQRVNFVASQAESALPSKQVQWQNHRERTQRQRTLGWHTDGLYIQLYGPSDERLFPENPVPSSAVIPLDDAILVASRNGVHLNNVAASLPTPLPQLAVDEAMHRLAEHATIVSAVDAGITFMGEFVSRLPLTFELATFVANATALGLPEIAAVVAAIATIPLRASPPPRMDKAKWAAAVEASRRKFRVGTNDILSDAKAYVAYVDAENKAAFAEENGFEEELLKQVSDLALSVLDQLSDYTFRENPTPAQLRAQLESRATALTMLLAVALSRRTTIVRNEGNIGNATPSGNLMFIRSPKEILKNSHVQSNAEWKLGNAVVSATITNATTKMFASDSFSVSTNFFFAALLLLHPCVDYSAPQLIAGKQSILFSAISCRHTKRLRLDIADGASVLDFREKWTLALGCLQAKRSLPASTTMAAYTMHLKTGSDRAIHLQQLQNELLSQLATLAADMDVSEHQATFPTFSTHRLAPAAVGAPLAAIADASDVAIAKNVAKGIFAPAAAATTGAAVSTAGSAAHAAAQSSSTAKPASGAAATAAPATAAAGGHFGDDVAEEDGATGMTFHASFVPIEEDDDVEDDEATAGKWRSQGPLIEDDDE